MMSWWQWTILGIIVVWLLYAALPTLWVRKHHHKSSILLLTFDDGPDEQVTPMILKLLKKYKQHAIFFITGKSVPGNESIIHQLIEEGHEVGVHGMNHYNHLWLSPWKTTGELRQGYHVLKSLGYEPRFFRGPYGSYNMMTLWQCKKYGLQPMQWDGIHQDWRILPEGTLYESLCKNHQDGGIVLLHDGQQGNATQGANMFMVEELEKFLERMTAHES